MQIHKGYRLKVKCEECIKSFSTTWNLRQHIKSMHPHVAAESICTENIAWEPVKNKYSKKLPTCHICKRSFPKKYILKKQNDAYHSDRTFNCGDAEKADANVSKKNIQNVIREKIVFELHQWWWHTFDFTFILSKQCTSCNTASFFHFL